MRRDLRDPALRAEYLALRIRRYVDKHLAGHLTRGEWVALKQLCTEAGSTPQVEVDRARTGARPVPMGSVNDRK